MTSQKIIQEAIVAAKRCILENLDSASEYTGTVNPYGDRTLLLDVKAEDEIISVLHSSGIEFAILTEEKGFVKSVKKAEYLALVDPIDGSANLERGIPLVSIGISIVPYQEKMTSDDAVISVIDSVFTDETYIAVTGKGVTKNGKNVRTRAPVTLDKAIISYDTKRTWDEEFVKSSLSTIQAVHDTRRSASNLLDLCWTAAGYLDGMVDLRNMLPIIHICGTHMVFEAGGYVLDRNGNRFNSSLEPENMMNFVAASNETLARQILARFNEHVEHMFKQNVLEDQGRVEEEPVMLMVLSGEGFLVYSKNFTLTAEMSDRMIGSFLQTVQKFGHEVFSKALDRIKFETYTLLIRSKDPLTFCYIYNGQSYSAQQKLNEFIDDVLLRSDVWDTLLDPIKTGRTLDPDSQNTLDALLAEVFVKPANNLVP